MATLVVATGCIVDTDQPCDDNQVKFQGTFTGCGCESGFVPNPSGPGCIPCGEHEEPSGTECVCVAGYARTRATEPCLEISDGGATAGDGGTTASQRGAGTPCDSDADCAGYEASFCLTLTTPTECFVPDCASGNNVCLASEDCCVVDAVPVLAETNGLCVPAGDCISPGTVVTP